MSSPSIDFSKIIKHEGSQWNAFEELVCQLARLDPPKNADYFFPKEGKGGDGGVECFWKLKDGSEFCWQAKYHIENLKAHQWDKLTRSFNQALQKHPMMVKYYVCIATKLEDGRKKFKGKGPYQDKWEQYRSEWTQIAREQGRVVDFVLWDKNAILSQLQRDDPRYIGRAHYWFGTPILQLGDFEKLAQHTKKELSKKYLEEFHVEVDTSISFEALGRTEKWKNILNERINKWIKGWDKLVRAYRYFNRINGVFFKDLCDKKCLLLKSIETGFIGDSIHLKLDELCKVLNEISNFIGRDIEGITEGFKDDNYTRGYFYELLDFVDQSQELSGFCIAPNQKLANSNSMLLEGIGGSGKSHLLCHVALNRLKDKKPTVFVLGQHYGGGNPVEFLKDKLDLKDLRDGEFLAALDACAEAKRERLMIVVDAINEGCFSEAWYDHLYDFILKISEYPYLCLVFSCKSPLVEHLIPDTCLSNDELVRIRHTGFQGKECEAIRKYLTERGISNLGIPTFSPEFSNPLFLVTCSEAILKTSDNGNLAFPTGVSGLSDVFSFFLDSVEKVISGKKKYRKEEKVVQEILRNLAMEMLKRERDYIPVDEARAILEPFDSRYGGDNADCFYDLLRYEGVLTEEVDHKNTLVVRFTYQRYSDHIKACSIVDSLNEDELDSVFKESGRLSFLVDKMSIWRHEGILNSLSMILPEKFGVEMYDLVLDELRSRWHYVDRFFTDGLLLRSKRAFSDRTLEILNKMPSTDQFQWRALDIMIQLSTEPDHPWNADRLHQFLMKRSLPERDRFWSIHVGLSDWEQRENRDESAVRSIINWASSVELKSLDQERVRLAGIVLIWMTSCTNSKVRDQATKSVVRIITSNPEVMKDLIETFQCVDDLYVLERLYAIAYGVVSNIEDIVFIKETAAAVYRAVFESGVVEERPHLLVRDYARGVMEVAKKHGVLPSEVDKDCFRAPYSSPWPLIYPNEKEIENISKEDNSIKISLIGYGDRFGRHEFDWIRNWGLVNCDEATSLDNEQLELQSIDDAKRWVCRRAYELGWKKELFGEFEEFYCSYDRRSYYQVDRIGLKYQWIALYEYFARLTDNCCYFEEGKKRVYEGPWQDFNREIDPTCLLSPANEIGAPSWVGFQDFVLEGRSREELDDWLAKDDIPPFRDLVQVSDPSTGEKWYVLHSFQSRSRDWEIKKGKPYQNAWYRINACLIEKNAVKEFVKNLKGENLCSPSILGSASIGYQVFLREYPWHTSCDSHTTWRDGIWDLNQLKVKHHVPTVDYFWEHGERDYSISKSVNVCLPSKFLVDKLGLVQDLKSVGMWNNSEGKTVFFDPFSFSSKSPVSLIDTSVFNEFIEQLELSLVWLVGGEKYLHSEDSTEFFGRMMWSSVLWTNGEEIQQEKWSKLTKSEKGEAS